MSDNIDIRVSGSLHPGNVRELDGYDEDTAAVLAPTETAFSAAYLGVKAVWEARDKASTNPTWNEAQQILHTDDFANKHLGRITRAFDNVRGNLKKGIAHLEQEMTAPVEAKAALSVAAEIRAHVKGMKTEERHNFIQQAMDAGDQTTVTAVLGAPSYLSGLTSDFQKTYTRFYHEQNNPQMAKRLKAMTAAREMIETRAGLVFQELEKAVGVPPHKARALREAKTNAEKAFILSDA